MTDEDYIKAAVELADGWSMKPSGHVCTPNCRYFGGQRTRQRGEVNGVKWVCQSVWREEQGQSKEGKRGQ